MSLFLCIPFGRSFNTIVIKQFGYSETTPYTTCCSDSTKMISDISQYLHYFLFLGYARHACHDIKVKKESVTYELQHTQPLEPKRLATLPLLLISPFALLRPIAQSLPCEERHNNTPRAAGSSIFSARLFWLFMSLSCAFLLEGFLLHY